MTLTVLLVVFLAASLPTAGPAGSIGGAASAAEPEVAGDPSVAPAGPLENLNQAPLSGFS